MKLIVKAVDRKLPDNVGTYLWESLLPAAKRLGIELIRVPTDLWYNRPGISLGRAARLEVNWINSQNADAFLFFTNWIGGGSYRIVAQEYKRVKCKKILWSREDPNHYNIFLTDSKHVDIIGTCCSACIPKYQKQFPNKHVILLPFAATPELFYPGVVEPEFDIVHLGNRYRNRKVRIDGERAVIVAAAVWAKKHNKKMGVWGYEYGTFGWQDTPEIFNTGIFQGGRCGRLEAASIYRNAKIALSIASNDYSPTMCPNKVPQILATNIPLIAYSSPATLWISDDNANISASATETEQYLNNVFFNNPQEYKAKAERAYKHTLANHTFKHRLITILEAIDAL